MGSEVILEIEEKSGPSPRLFSEMLEYESMYVSGKVVYQAFSLSLFTAGSQVVMQI